MNLFWKIYLAVFASFVVAVAAISYGTSARQISDARRRILNEHEMIGSFIVADLEHRRAESEWPFESLARLSQHNGFLFWWIVEEGGTIRLADQASFIGSSALRYFPEAPAPVLGEDRVILNRRKNYGLIIRSFGAGRRRWSFWLGFSTAVISQAIRRITLAAIVFSTVALAILAIVLYLTIKHFTKPIQVLAQGAAIVGNGDLSHRVSVTSDDELGWLAHAFNEMAEHLETTMTSIDRLNREIAERKRIEKELRFSEERFRILFEYAPDAYFLHDLQGRLLDINKRAEQLVGYGRDEQIGRTIFELGVLLPSETDRIRSLVDESTSGPNGPHEMILQRKDGSQILVEITTFPVRIKDDLVVLGIARDITDRKAAEDKIRQHAQIQSTLNRLLSLSLEDLSMDDMLRQAIDCITSTIGFSLEPKGAIFLIDDKQETLVMTAQRGMAAPLSILCARVPFGRCVCGRAARSREIEFVDCVDDRHETTFEGIGPHGHYGVPILSGGKVLGVINMYVREGHRRCREEEGFLRAAADVLAGVIERKQAEKQQAALLEQLAAKNQELKDFAYIVSHDLKAPLRGIRVIVDWLHADYLDGLDDQGKEYLMLLTGRVDRMQDLIDGVLQYSRVGRTEQGTTPVDLGQLVPEIVANLDAPEHISIQIESDLPTVEADPTRITQVFQNLLSNAIKYMDKPQGEIRVGWGEEEGFWKFSVCDNGPGIEQKHFERIFKLFQTITARDSRESTGVGLTIAKKIVEMYGGRIWVESEVGRGSTFFLTLPKRQMEASDAQVRIGTACTL